MGTAFGLSSGPQAANTAARAAITRLPGMRTGDEAAWQEIAKELEKGYVSGITFSGGDPLYPGNREETGRLIRKVKQEFPDKTIWLYTGYTWEEINDLPYIGLIDVLVDGRFEEELADSSLKWKGSSNQRVIRVKKSMEAKRVILHQE